MPRFYDDIGTVSYVTNEGVVTEEGSIDDHRTTRSRWGLPGALDHDTMTVRSAEEEHQRVQRRSEARTDRALIEADIAARRERRALPRPVDHDAINTLSSEEWQKALREAARAKEQNDQEG